MSDAKDSSERQQAAQALRMSEERFRALLGDMQDGYYEVDLAGTHTFANDSLAEILGHSHDEMMGMSYKQYMDQENAGRVFEIFNRVYRTDEPVKEFEYEITRKDGTKRTVQSSISLVKDSENQMVGFRGIVHDITEYERTLSENTRLLQETQAHVERERLVRTITDQIRRLTDKDTIMQVALHELGRMLGASKSIVHLGTQEQLLSIARKTQEVE